MTPVTPDPCYVDYLEKRVGELETALKDAAAAMERRFGPATRRKLAVVYRAIAEDKELVVA
jgi:hypothetical protein